MRIEPENALQAMMRERERGLYNGFDLRTKGLIDTNGEPEGIRKFLKEEFVRFKMMNSEKTEHEWHFREYVLKGFKWRWKDEELKERLKKAVQNYFEEMSEPQQSKPEEEPTTGQIEGIESLKNEVEELREAVEEARGDGQRWTIEEQIVCLHELGIIQALKAKNPSSVHAIARAIAPALNRKLTSIQPKLNRYFRAEQQSEILTLERVEKVRREIEAARIESI